jgi:hypothetical protein
MRYLKQPNTCRERMVVTRDCGVEDRELLFNRYNIPEFSFTIV